MEVNMIEDLSKLTTINKSSLDKIFNKVIWCISDSIERATLSGENIVEVNFEFGSIIINILPDSIKYKFKPSPLLEETVINTVINNKNEFKLVLEKELVSKITNLYKDMF